MTSQKKTGFVYHADYLNHDTGMQNPERPERLQVSIKALQTSDFWGDLHQIEATPVTIEQICYAHAQEHIDRVKWHCENNIPIDYDTPTSPASYDIARLSAGGVLRIADAVMAGNVSNAFALVRPPGHHATRIALWVSVCSTTLQSPHDIYSVNTEWGVSQLLTGTCITAMGRRIPFMMTLPFSFSLLIKCLSTPAPVWQTKPVQMVLLAQL